jgi:translocation and assembly module TamA
VRVNSLFPVSVSLRRAPATIALLATLAAAPVRATVELEGVEGALAANVLAFLDLDEEPCDTPRWRVEQLELKAPVRVREALQAFGYYEPRVRSSVEFDADCWRVTLTIEPGEPIRIRTLDVELTGEAAGDAAFAAVASRAELTSGAILDQGVYEARKRGWADLARERGYAEAAFVVNRIDVYPEQHAADIALHFDSGPRYGFGRVELVQDVLTDALVRSYVQFKEGEPYDGRRLTELYAELVGSGYFRTINVRSLEPDRASRIIPVQIELTGAARRQISYGIGFSTDTGPRFRFGRNNRRFNERGHQFGVNAQLSPVISEVTANYRLPLKDSRTEWVNYDTGIKHEKTDTADSNSLELGARRVLERPGDWTRTLMATFQIEDFEVAGQIGRSQLLMPGADWTRVEADNAIRPSKGSRMELQVRAANAALGSDTSLVQTVAQGKWIRSLPQGGRFLVRAHVGATATHAFAELPPSVRFFAGGDNSVRGYDFETLGPVDANGEVIGGSRLAVGSFEFEQPLRARWSLAFFVDSGNAFEGSRIDAKTGAGLGGRWQSPLGPIRIDVAHPFNDPANDWQVHISLGPDL